jgi:hypothetical protein
MALESLNLESQLSELERLRSQCVTARDTVNSIWEQLRELSENETELVVLIREQHESDLRRQLERTAQEASDRLTELQQNVVEARENTNRSHQHKLRDLEAVHKDGLAAIRQKLQSELWVLQSVCDETNEETPVREAERERDIYETHRKFTTQQLSDVAERVQYVQKYLERCHSGTDAVIPPINVSIKGREASRTMAIEQAEQALESANFIDRQNLPQWICGWRIWGLTLLIFFVVAIVTTGIRADLRLFVNPELQNPDWRWLGISCLIGAAVAVLLGSVLLMTVQSRLRGAFEEMLQHVANARSAIEYWTARSEQELAKGDEAATTWKTAMLQHRERNSMKLKYDAEDQISKSTQAYDDQVAQQERTYQEQVATNDAEFTRLKSAIEKWRHQEMARIQVALQSEHDETLAALTSKNKTVRNLLHAEVAATISQWQADVSAAREIASVSRQRVAAFPRWANLRGTGWTAPTSLPGSLPIGDLLVTLPAPPESEIAHQDSS